MAEGGMMAKKFMYVCIGIMALAVTFHIGAEYGIAKYVDHSTEGIVASYRENYDYYLLENGEVWMFDNGWQHESQFDPPVPVNQIKFWGRWEFVTLDNDLIYLDYGTWRNAGPPPGVAATEPSTWGKIKAQWGE